MKGGFGSPLTTALPVCQGVGQSPGLDDWRKLIYRGVTCDSYQPCFRGSRKATAELLS